MEKTIELVQPKTTHREVKKATLQAQSEYEFDLLSRSHPDLLPVAIFKTESGIIFEFQTSSLTPLAEVDNLNEIDTLRTLIDVLNLFKLYQTLKFDLNPKNLYQDISLNVKVAHRDVHERGDIADEESFVREYLCLLGAMMQDKHTYENFKESGTDLLEKRKATKPFAHMKKITEIESSLTELLVQTKKTQDKTMTLVRKDQFEKLRRTTRIAFATSIVLLGLSAYLCFHQNQFLRTTNEGFSAYIRSDYNHTVGVLSELNINRMDHTIMYTLASAHIRTEPLEDEQRDNILAGVTPTSSERVLEFWVLLSQGDYEEAIDIARLLGNNDYLVYGYLRKRAGVEQDPNLSGAERESQLEEIDDQLSEFELQYQQTLEETIEEALEEAPEQTLEEN